MKHKRKSNVKLPREREERFMNETRQRADELIDYIADLDIDQESKDYLCDEIEDLCNIQMALLKRTSIKRLSPPWDHNKMS